jgi:hypothetical protein
VKSVEVLERAASQVGEMTLPEQPPSRKLRPGLKRRFTQKQMSPFLVGIVAPLVESSIVGEIVIEAVQEQNQIGVILQDGLIEVDQVVVTVEAGDRSVDDLHAVSRHSSIEGLFEVEVDGFVVTDDFVLGLTDARERAEPVACGSPHEEDAKRVPRFLDRSVAAPPKSLSVVLDPSGIPIVRRRADILVGIELIVHQVFAVVAVHRA